MIFYLIVFQTIAKHFKKFLKFFLPRPEIFPYICSVEILHAP